MGWTISGSEGLQFKVLLLLLATTFIACYCINYRVIWQLFVMYHQQLIYFCGPPCCYF